MDIKLPGMNGIEASFHIKEERPDIPIIIQTAYTLNNERQKAMDAGCDDYLTKPIEINFLLEKIEKIFITN
ncbi:MAG: response regulator [Prolixibacteraceae bacterium]|jgi:CheY-like chemotaxis protein|nr:response regulator [Prolixibacteraceae bacterium]